jgi:multiple sugar transport system ATP-binding protein
VSSLKISGLYKRFGAADILKDVNLDIKSGEFIVFVGPSGCGKSTLLRCISGLESISAGTLEIDGRKMNDVTPAKRGIAMVFQSYALYPHMSVFDNIGYSLRLQKTPAEERRARILKAAETLQLTPLLDRLPKQLSGGQRQRVAIGRAIVRDPKVFLFDEPLSNLDASLRVQMRIEIADLKRQLPDTTMIYVTHDQVEAMTMADRIVVLKDGVVQQVGSPLDLYNNPNSLFVAGFIGSPKMNFLAGAFAEGHGAATIGVRPEHMAIGAGPWEATVTHIERLGSDSYLYLDASGTNLTARAAGTSAVNPGERISLGPSGLVHRFDAAGIAL